MPKTNESSSLPFFPFYAADWIGSTRVQLMSAAEEGTFIRLLAFAWRNEGLPENAEQIRRLTKLDADEFNAMWPLVTELFPFDDDGRRRNERQERERVEAKSRHSARVSAGSLGAKRRWHGNSNANGDAIRLPIANQCEANSNHNHNHNHSHNHQQTAVATTARERATDDDGKALERAALDLTVAANQAIVERFGEQLTVLRASQPGAFKLADALRTAGVPVDWATGTIRSLVAHGPLEKPPRSVLYFAGAIIERWEAAVARGAASPVRAQGEVDAMTRMAIAGARNGDSDWQTWCDERSVAWREHAP